MPRPSPVSRAGLSYRVLLIALAIVAAGGVSIWLVISRIDWSADGEGMQMHTVERGDFLHQISEKGEVESASNIEIRCEVKARGGGGTTILSIIPEGTYVQPGDLLVELDASALQNELNQQLIVCSSSEANVVTARNDLKAAEIAMTEYVKGTYVLEENAIRNKMFVAAEAQRQAEQTLAYTERLARKGYVTDLQVETDKIAVDKAKLDYRSAELELEVLQEYAKERQIRQLDSNIKVAKARLRSAEASHKLDLEQKELVESQVAKCKIYAEEPGQVVYANETNRRGGQEIVIEEGVTVRERQVIIRLPDPRRMQVKAKINEAKIALVSEGMPVEVRLSAMPDQVFEGFVERVNEYPAPVAWWAGNIKQYETFIKIVGSPEGLKPGLSAEVRIQVESLSDIILVPVLAVLEHGGKHYCAMRDGEGWSVREVKVGSTNDKTVVILEGLKEGDEVVLGISALRDDLDLPELQEEEPTRRGRRGKSPSIPAVSPKKQPGKDASRKRPPSGDPFKQLDKNGDGKVEKSEAPEQMKQFFGHIDTNSDGAIDRAEWAAARKRMEQRNGGPPRPPGGARP
jgi:multidrug efflux pump subunit AcrA (membrane-fusion protein)